MTVYLRCAINLCFEFADCLKILWFAAEEIYDFCRGSDFFNWVYGENFHIFYFFDSCLGVFF